MKVITTTQARENLAKLVNSVTYTNTPIAIGRRNKAEALLIKFPAATNELVDDITNMNQYGEAFAWLEEEPDIYTITDVKKMYV